MKKATAWVSLVALAPLLGLWIGCERGKPIEEIEMREIIVGGVVPLSGYGAYWGRPIVKGWKDGAEVINARGGIKIGDKRGDAYKFKIIAYDSKGTEAGAKEAATRLVEEDKAHYLFSQGTANISGVLEIAKPKKLILMTASRGDTEKLGPNHPNSFRVEMSDYELGFAYIPFMKEHYADLKTAAFIGPDDQDGRASHRSYQRLMEHFGIEDLGKQFFQRETTDFDSVVSEIVALKPDCIITSPTPPKTTASIVIAVRKTGYKGPIVSPAASEAKTIIEVAGEFADNVVLPMTLESSHTEYQKALRERFNNRFGSYEELAGIYSWWVYALEQALVVAGSFENTTAVASALENVVLEETYVGRVRFGGAGEYGLKRQAIYDGYTTIIQAGKANVVDVRSPALPEGY